MFEHLRSSLLVPQLTFVEMFGAHIDVVPVTRLEAFRALKFSRLESFRALNPYSQIGGFYDPKTLQIGEF